MSVHSGCDVLSLPYRPLNKTKAGDYHEQPEDNPASSPEHVIVILMQRITIRLIIGWHIPIRMPGTDNFAYPDKKGMPLLPRGKDPIRAEGLD